MPYTAGFHNNSTLMLHFQKHGIECNAVDCTDYLNKADVFLGSPITRDMLECTRPSGEYVRYNKVTGEFGVVDKDNFILTYFIKTVPSPNFSTAADYMREKCR